jgi:hypothetical protein
MSSFFASAIQKKKKEDFKGAKKVPKEDLNTIDTVKPSDVPKTDKVKSSGFIKSNKITPEEGTSIDLLLSSAKKKSSSPKKDVVLSDMGEQMEENEDAMKKDRYLKSVNKYKKGK